MTRRLWLTASISLFMVALAWLTQEWWLPLLPGVRKQTLDWTETWGAAVQTGADILATLAMLGAVLSTWLGLSQREPTAPTRPEQYLGPLRQVTLQILLEEKLAGGAAIQWVDRGASNVGDLRRSPRLILTGVSRMGKTREALELIRSAVREDLVSQLRIYEPEYRDLRFRTGDGLEDALRSMISPDLPTLLLVDDFPYHFAGKVDRKRLETTLTALQRCKQHFVVMTGRIDQLTEEQQDWLRNHGVPILKLDGMDQGKMTAFVRNSADVLEIKVMPDATQRLVAHANGVPEVARQTLLRLQHQGVRQVDSAAVDAVGRGTVQELWAQTRHELIHRWPATRYLLDALAAFHASKVRRSPEMVLAYAAALWRQNQRRPIWRRGQKLHQALSALAQYEIRVVEGEVQYPDQVVGDTPQQEIARQAVGHFLIRRRRWLQRRGLRWLNRSQDEQRWAIFDLARDHGDEERNVEAVALYTAAIDVGPHFAFYNNRGIVRKAQGDLAAVIADYDHAIALNPVNAAVYTNRGNALNDQGDLAAAIANYDHAIALNPQVATAFCGRGIARQAQGDLAAAIADYDHAITLNPQFATAFCGRGTAHQAQGDLATAIADYDHAIALNPEFAAAFCGRGIARQAQGDLTAAIADYDHAIALNPEEAAAYNNRGIARKAQGDLAATIADYDLAIALNLKEATAYINRGNARQDQGDLAAAIADYDHAIALSSSDQDKASWGLCSKGVVLRQLQRWDEAFAVYQQATALDDTSGIGWMGLADAGRAVGDETTWQAALSKARALLTEADAYDRACLASIAGEVELALALLAEALAAKPDQATWARNDPELRWLHDDEHFWALVG